MTYPAQDPFASDPDEDDPFATEEDVKRTFNPSPKMDDLHGRLLVIVPRKLEDGIPVPEAFAKEKGETQERYTADVIVLDGGPLSFTIPASADGKIPEKTYEVTEFPVMYPDKWIFEQSIVGQLKTVDGGPRPLLCGVLVRAPQKKQRDAGQTVEQTEALYAAWLKNPKGQRPPFSWRIDVAGGGTDRAKALRANWWRSAKEQGFKLTK